MKVITIGRSKENNNVIVNDEKVSRNHLQIVQDDQGRCSVMDLGSTNGTFVNGQRISGEVPLHKGDELRVGGTLLPWENYISANIDAPSPSPTPSPSLSLTECGNKPSRSKWWLWVIVVVVALMVAGGIAWWLCSRSTKIPEPSTPSISLDSLRAAAYADEIKLQRIRLEQAADKARLDSLAKVDLSKLSDDEKKAHEKEKKTLESQIQQKENEKGTLEKNLATLNDQIITLDKQLKKTRDSLVEVNKGITEANNAKDEANRKNNLILEMQEILNGWNESTAAAFCDKQSPKWSYADKKEAKNAIVKKFKTLDEKTMKQKVNEMRNFKKKEDAKPTESAPKTPSLQTPTESQPDTNKTKE